MHHQDIISREKIIQLRAEPQEQTVPLVVDLDGTLINTDLLWEGMILLLKKNPLYIFLCIPWLIKGKVYLKNRILQIIRLRYDLIPFNTELLKFLQNESRKGRKLVLATASLRTCAVEICKRCPIFDEIYGTDNITNLKGKHKLALLLHHFGKSNFDYIGNSRADFIIFHSSRYSYLVNPSRGTQSKTLQLSNLQKVWQTKKNGLKNAIRSLRVYQWVKNVLVFVPLLTSHSFYSFNLAFQAFTGFLAFSFAASAGYLINDLCDINSDRGHPRKKSRAIASGDLPIPYAIVLAIALLAAAMCLASLSSSYFWAIILGYFFTSVCYSLYLKKLVLYDVFILALLYSIRVIAGAVIVSVPLSFWLIAFSTFIFLSLALVKRYSELMKITEESSLKSRGREYLVGDLHLLEIVGIVSGFLSVVVFSLYIDSHEVKLLYANPKVLWTMSFLFLFWISRIWLLTIRGKMTDDPIIFALKDRTSYVISLLIALTIYISM